jgi:histidinol-phosphate aminotransferase
VHGGIRPAQLRRLGLDPSDVLDFSASVSPLGPPQGLWDALQKVDLTAYPDPECLELKEALARSHDIEADHILVGNGSTELIHLLARAYLGQSSDGSSHSVLLLTPTYGEYAGACSLERAEVLQVEACREAGIAWDLERVAAVISNQRPTLVFLCNPNNPTGIYLGAEEVARLADIASHAESLLVLDEAYVNFVDNQWDSTSLLRINGGQNVALLRSMTKDYALTGLRLGYVLAHPDTIAMLTRLQPDWSVNGLAQAAGLVAIADTTYLERARRGVAASRDCAVERLTALGIRCYPTEANFVLTQVGDAAKLRDALARRGLFVRDCASFGLPDCIRIGLRPVADCVRLADAIASVLDSGSRPE